MTRHFILDYTIKHNPDAIEFTLSTMIDGKKTLVFSGNYMHTGINTGIVFHDMINNILRVINDGAKFTYESAQTGNVWTARGEF